MDAADDPVARFRLDGKVALVTGASSGLGARFARVLDAAGARVVVAARRAERLDALVAELTDAHAVAGDLADPGARTALVRAVVERAGRIDVMVNNAGVQATTPSTEVAMDDFRRAMAVNLEAPFELAREAARVMIADGRGGAIVNIASVLGLVGSGVIPDAAYAASKGALVNLTRQLGAEWAPSEMTGSMFGDERSEAWIRRNTPMGRAGAAHELDGALLFLASDASSYVTGVTVPVDGGWTAV
jgi:NAD(P)-dependent dehydrogenase (short-subunit alcohol dehydrogenase family)